MPSMDDRIAPPTALAARALELARERCRPSVLAHAQRSWVIAAALGERLGVSYDAELLYVAALLHDIGLEPHFDSVSEPFEDAGGAVAGAFGAGAGWDAARRRVVAEVIELHMRSGIDPATKPEAYLLEVATGLDVAGVGMAEWDADFLRELVAAVPRGSFSLDFRALLDDQALRKPDSQANRVQGSGGIERGEEAWEALVARAAD